MTTFIFPRTDEDLLKKQKNKTQPKQTSPVSRPLISPKQASSAPPELSQNSRSLTGMGLRLPLQALTWIYYKNSTFAQLNILIILPLIVSFCPKQVI